MESRTYYQHELDRLEEEQEGVDEKARQLEKQLRSVMEKGKDDLRTYTAYLSFIS